MIRIFGLTILLLLLLVGCQNKPQADTIILDANIWTGNPGQPNATAMAIAGNKILAVGSIEQIEALAGPNTKLIDAAGGMITPGFIDSHVHFITGGFRLASVQLRDASTKEEFIKRIGDFAKTLPAGAWITGGDWDHTLWGGDLPERTWIDAVTPNNSVWINRLDGHMALANSLALEAAGVTENTTSPAGGTLIRDKNNQPTGLLKDNAMFVVDRVVPDPPDDLNDRALNAAMDYVAANGVTSVHAVGGWGDLAVYERAHDQNNLRTRIYASVPLSTWERLAQKISDEGKGDNWLHIGGLKGFVDGSLGSHTAAFLAPFSDTPADVNTPEDLKTWISGADSAGLQMLIHAIGDRAIRLQLDVFEQVANENPVRDRRFRIEHAQHINQADIPRFAKLGVIPSMQPYHAIDDGRWATEVIGQERLQEVYAFNSLIESGAMLAFGSDWFVAPPTPLEGIYAAVTRRTLDGTNPDGWVPEQKISLDQALTAYTSNAAYAEFMEDKKGILKPGMLADFVWIDKDLASIPPAEINTAKIMMTVVDGKIVYDGSTSNQTEN